MADSQAHLHGKRYAMYGDPDQMLGLPSSCWNSAPSRRTCWPPTAPRTGRRRCRRCSTSPYGAGCKVYPKRDLWHMRSLLFTEPVDFLIGNTYGKYLERDTARR
jgi:nitrogenase molybdenum-iron protein beta chain